jgi:hypothetical protein
VIGGVDGRGAAMMRVLLLVFGASVACGATCLLLALLWPSSPAQPRPPDAALRLVARPAGDDGLPGLTARDSALLHAALPGVTVGAAIGLSVAEIAPPLLPVEALEIVAAEPGWLTLQGFSLDRGRAFTVQESAGGAPVCLVSPRLAQGLSGEASPVGRHLRLDGSWLTVIGQLGAAPSGLGPPDLLLPLEAGLRRVVDAEHRGVDELLVQRATGPGLEALVQRVLAREHPLAPGWELIGGGGGRATGSGSLGVLAGLLGCLCVAGLAVFAQALPPSGSTAPPGGVPTRWRPLVLGLLMASPGLVAAWLALGPLADLAGGPAVPSAWPWVLGPLPVVVVGALVGLVSLRDPAS